MATSIFTGLAAPRLRWVCAFHNRDAASPAATYEVNVMLRYCVAYAGAATTFLVLDLIWLGFVAKEFYRSNLGALLTDEINGAAAIIFYVLYIVGIMVFAVTPAFESGSWRTALIFGALFGLFAYATYDLTNLATLRDWPIAVSAVDMAWGTFLTGASATVGFLAANLLKSTS